MTMLLWSLTAFALCLRLLMTWHHPATSELIGDSQAYVEMAQHFISRSGWAVSGHPPGYPLFLTPFLWSSSAHGITVAVIAQDILGACCVPLVCWFTRRAVSSDLAALVAAAFVTVDPFLIYFGNQVLSETLFTFLLLAGFCFLGQAFDSERKYWPAAAGLFMGISVLTRSILLPLVPFLTIVVCISPPGFARRWIHGVIFVAALSFPIALWSYVLHSATGQWVASSAQKGWNTYEGLNPNFEDPQAIDAWQKDMHRDAEAAHLGVGVERDNYFWEKSKQLVKKNPSGTAFLMARKFFKFWRVWPYFPYSTSERIISAVFMIPLLFLALSGCYGLWRDYRDRWTLWTMLGFVLLYALLNTISWTQIRYRVPIHPMLAVFAGIGMITWIGGTKKNDA